MASKAVNINSFVNYIVSVSKYYDNTSLSEENKTQLKNFLLDKFNVNPSQALNVGTAINLLQNLRVGLGKVAKAVSVEGNNYGAVLSVNTAKTLVSLLYTSDVSNNYTTLYKWYYTPLTSGKYNVTNLYNGELLDKPLFRVDGSNAAGLTVQGYLYGGGGGGSGAVAGDGDKNASYTITSGAGGIGGTSSINLNGSTILTKAGGSGGTAITSGKVPQNPEISYSGLRGNDSSPINVSFQLYPNDLIEITTGLGGGGGGGIAASAGGTTGTVSWTAYSGSGSTGGKTVATANEWSGEDMVGANGGGGGGGWRGNVGAKGNNYYYQGPSGYVIYPENGGTDGVGGVAYAENTQPTGLGEGGNGGISVFQVDEWALAYGGNGGNRGGLVIFDCAAKNCLMGIRH